MAIGPTRPIRPARPSGHPDQEARPSASKVSRQTPQQPENHRLSKDAVVQHADTPAVEIDSSLFAHLQQIEQGKVINQHENKAGTEAYEHQSEQAEGEALHDPPAFSRPSHRHIWDLDATIRTLALDLDTLLVNLFGMDPGAAHDVTYTLIQALTRRTERWQPQSEHRYLVTERSLLTVTGTGVAKMVVGDPKLVSDQKPEVFAGLSSDRVRPGLHHHGEVSSWLRIETVIHEIRARFGHIDFRRMRSSSLEGRASQGLHSVIVFHAEGSRRGMATTENSMLVFDTVTHLKSKHSDEALGLEIDA